jgi:hypothetical protein
MTSSYSTDHRLPIEDWGRGTLLTSWTKFSSGSSKPRRSRFPLGERSRRPLLRNSPRAYKLSSFSLQQAAGVSSLLQLLNSVPNPNHACPKVLGMSRAVPDRSANFISTDLKDFLPRFLILRKLSHVVDGQHVRCRRPDFFQRFHFGMSRSFTRLSINLLSFFTDGPANPE